MPIAQGEVVDVKEAIYSKVSEEDIMNYYLGVIHLPTVICSPLRKDTKPSLGLHYSKDGHICFKDFATGEGGSLIHLIGQSLGLSSYRDALWRIYNDLVLNPNSVTSVIQSPSNTTHRQKRKSPVVDIQVAIRTWKPWDIEYWNSYGVTKRFLKFSNVYPISHVFFIKEDGSCVTIPADKHAYAYVEAKDEKISLKIYQPFSKTCKWVNKHTADVWDLWQQLPLTGDNLIITSSRKDAMCIWCNTGIPACSLQAESYLPKQSVINELKRRFKKIFILYDNDFTKDVNHGREYGRLLATTFNLPQIELPTVLRAKDSSDLYQLRGPEVLRKTIFNLIGYEEDETCPF